MNFCVCSGITKYKIQYVKCTKCITCFKRHHDQSFLQQFDKHALEKVIEKLNSKQRRQARGKDN